MYIKDSKYRLLKHKKVSFSYGDFYFFEKYIVSEIHEGSHITYEIAQTLIEAAVEHYGEGAKLGYISNRINSYSLLPQDWLKFFKEKNNIVALAIVAYTKISFMNVVLEKIFSSAPIRKFRDMDEAVDWITKFKEEKVSK